MRLPFRLILAILCLNMGFYVVSQVCPLPSSAVTLTPSDISGEFDPGSDELNPPSPGPLDWLWYIVWGVPKFIECILCVFVGFPWFLASIGAPLVITGPITAILGFIWVVFIWELWTGRRVID